MYIVTRRQVGGTTSLVAAACPVVHETFQKAEAEALRLAKQYHNYEFIVFKAACTVAVKPVYETTITNL
jgi:hypothetical protein